MTRWSLGPAGLVLLLGLVLAGAARPQQAGSVRLDLLWIDEVPDSLALLVLEADDGRRAFRTLVRGDSAWRLLDDAAELRQPLWQGLSDSARADVEARLQRLAQGTATAGDRRWSADAWLDRVRPRDAGPLADAEFFYRWLDPVTVVLWNRQREHVTVRLADRWAAWTFEPEGARTDPRWKAAADRIAGLAEGVRQPDSLWWHRLAEALARRPASARVAPLRPARHLLLTPEAGGTRTLFAFGPGHASHYVFARAADSTWTKTRNVPLRAVLGLDAPIGSSEVAQALGPPAAPSGIGREDWERFWDGWVEALARERTRYTLYADSTALAGLRQTVADPFEPPVGAAVGPVLPWTPAGGGRLGLWLGVGAVLALGLAAGLWLWRSRQAGARAEARPAGAPESPATRLSRHRRALERIVRRRHVQPRATARRALLDHWQALLADLDGLRTTLGPAGDAALLHDVEEMRQKVQRQHEQFTDHADLPMDGMYALSRAFADGLDHLGRILDQNGSSPPAADPPATDRPTADPLVADAPTADPSAADEPALDETERAAGAGAEARAEALSHSAALPAAWRRSPQESVEMWLARLVEQNLPAVQQENARLSAEVAKLDAENAALRSGQAALRQALEEAQGQTREAGDAVRLQQQQAAVAHARLAAVEALQPLRRHLDEGLATFQDRSQHAGISGTLGLLTGYLLHQLILAETTADAARARVMQASLFAVLEKVQTYQGHPIHGFEQALGALQQRGARPGDAAAIARSDRRPPQHALFTQVLAYLRNYADLDLAPFYYDVDEQGQGIGFG